MRRETGRVAKNTKELAVIALLAGLEIIPETTSFRDILQP